MPGHPDWGGVQLLHGVEVVSPPTVYTVPGGSDVTPTFQLNRPGYQLTFTTVMSVSATVPFVTVRVDYFDPTFTDFIDGEHWILLCDNGNNITYSGRGPVRGGGLRVTITNLDATHTATVTMTVSQTTHHIARDDFRVSNVNANPVIPVYALWPDSYPQIGLIGAGTASVNPGATLKFIDFLYSGDTQHTYNGGGTSLTLQLRLPDALPASLGGNQIIWSDALTSSLISHRFILPRCPVMVTVNNSGASAETVNYSAMLLEYAS
jgi:hypothetical protein